MFTMVNAMQWVVRTVVQRANAVTLVIDKDDKGITGLRIVTCKLSTVMDLLYTVYNDILGTFSLIL